MCFGLLVEKTMCNTGQSKRWDTGSPVHPPCPSHVFTNQRTNKSSMEEFVFMTAHSSP